MTNKPIQAICNEGCQKEFMITKFRTRKAKGGTNKNYFTCPHCKQEYITYSASTETLKLQKEIRSLHRNAHAPDSGIDHRTFERLEAELKVKIKLSMDAARLVAES